MALENVDNPNAVSDFCTQRNSRDDAQTARSVAALIR